MKSSSSNIEIDLRLCLNLRRYFRRRRKRKRGEDFNTVKRALDRDLCSSNLVRDWLRLNDYEEKYYQRESQAWLLDDSLKESSGIDVSNNQLYVPLQTLRCAENRKCVCCMYKLVVSVPRKFRNKYVPNRRPEMCKRILDFKKNRMPPPSFSEHSFSSHDNVLVLGDGDLSYSCSISSALRGGRMTSTTYLTKKELYEVYDTDVVKRRMEVLTSLDINVQNGVDATMLGQSSCVFQNTKKKFTHVIWNFPCVAPPGAKINTSASRADGQNSEMSKNQDLLRRFFKTVHRVLAPGGEIRLTHKTKPPYCDWNIIEQASRSSNKNIEFQGCLVFDRVLYPGYTNRKARSGSGSFPVHDARIFVWKMKGERNNEPLRHTTTWKKDAVRVDIHCLRRVEKLMLKS